MWPEIFSRDQFLNIWLSLTVTLRAKSDLLLSIHKKAQAIQQVAFKFSLHTRLLFNASFLQVSQILKKDRSNLSVASNSPVEIPPKISVWVQDQRFHLKAASSRSICLIFLRDPRVEPSLKDGIQSGPSPPAQDHHQRHQLPFPLFDFDTRSLIWRLKIKDGIQRVPPPLQFPGQAA